jgi:hypothetical protein
MKKNGHWTEHFQREVSGDETYSISHALAGAK